MRDKVKSKFKSNMMSVLLTLCVSVMCFIGMSMMQPAAATLPEKTVQTWNNLSKPLPNGETHYYKVNCTNGSSTEDKYLKVTKTIESSAESSAIVKLTVYDGDSLSGAQASTSPSGIFKGKCSYSDRTETWTVSLTSGSTYSSINPSEIIVSSQSWGNLPAGLPNNTVNYYKVSCVKKLNGKAEDRYLKVVKYDDPSAPSALPLKVYEATSGKGSGGTYSTEESTNFQAEIAPVVLNASHIEGWNISLKPDGNSNPLSYNNNLYSKILSVDPLCTTIKSTKTWDGKNDAGNFANVSDQTIVKFNFNDGSENGQNFWVKKEPSAVKVSTTDPRSSGFDWNVKTSQEVLIDGQTINVLLIPSEGANEPEKWLITITGYDRHAADGELIEYQVDEKDIISELPWVCGAATLQHTMGGVNNPSGEHESVNFTYKLKLNADLSGEEEKVILEIEKQMTGRNVTGIVVRGMADSANIYTTIVGVITAGPSVKTYSDKPGTYITFKSKTDEPSETSIDDMRTKNGVTVNFNIGQDNGAATVVLKLTKAGRLSYEFTGLPTETYVPDLVGGTGFADGIEVQNYKVKVEASPHL